MIKINSRVKVDLSDYGEDSCDGVVLDVKYGENYGDLNYLVLLDSAQSPFQNKKWKGAFSIDELELISEGS